MRLISARWKALAVTVTPLIPVLLFSGTASAGDEPQAAFLEDVRKPPVDFHGFFHLDIEQWQKDGEEGGRPIFELEHVLLRAAAKPVERADIVLELFKETDHIPGFLQAYGAWTFHEALVLKAGKFLMPFGLQDQNYYCPLRFTSHFPETMEAVLPIRWAEVGLNVTGEIPVGRAAILYDVAAGNGLSGVSLSHDDQQFVADNNSDKLLGGRISLKWAPVIVGGSFASQKWDQSGSGRLSFWGAHAQLVQARGLQLKAEYAGSSVNVPAGAAVGGEHGGAAVAHGSFTRWGAYFEAAYRFPFKKHVTYLQPMIRYEMLDLDDMVDDEGDHWNLLFGMRVAMAETVFFTFEYAIRQETKVRQLENNVWVVGVNYAF